MEKAYIFMALRSDLHLSFSIDRSVFRHTCSPVILYGRSSSMRFMMFLTTKGVLFNLGMESLDIGRR